MTKRKEVLNGKPYAGNPHVRFDEGKIASATPRRGSLLYTAANGALGKRIVPAIVFLVFAMIGGTLDAKTWELKEATNATGLNKCTWGDSDGATSTTLSSDDDYVAEKAIYVSSADASLNTFTGRSLTMGTVGGTRSKIWHYGREARFENEGLVLASSGIYIRYPSTINRMIIYGKIAVTANESMPIIIDHIVDDYKTFHEDTVHFAGPLSGNGYLEINPCGFNNKNYGCVSNINLSLEGDASGFTGVITLKSCKLRESKYAWSGALCTSGLILPMGSMPASVKVWTKCHVSSPSATNVCALKSLELADGAQLHFKIQRKTLGESVYLTNDIIRVTESFALSGKVNLRIEHGDYSAGTPESVLTLLEMPSTCDVSESDFVRDDFYLRNSLLEFREDAERNVKSLVLVMKPIVAMRHEDTSADVQNDVGSVAVSDESYWSDSALPHDGAHYYLKRKTFRSVWGPGEAKHLNGISWTLEKTTFCILSSELEMGMLQIASSSASTLMCQYEKAPATLKTDVFMDSSRLDLCAYAQGKLVIDGEISGSGTITCIGNNRGSGNPGGFYAFEGLNTNYSGIVKVSMENVDGRPLSFQETPQKRFNSLCVSDARNLGGPMSPANPKGIILENMSRLEVSEDVDFNEPTRGFYIGWVGRMLVAEGKTMTLRNPIAVHGTMYKEGAGRLELGNETVTFGTSATDEFPHADATNHMFIVAGGTVKPLSSGCMDGLDVVISNSTAFVYDFTSEDAELARYGVRNVKTDNPFACAPGTEKMKVSIEAVPSYSHASTNGLFTVKNAQIAAAVRDILSVDKPSGKGGVMKLVEIADPETGYVTLAAEIRHYGTVISVR